MAEVLRRVQDLLVGDVVANEGKARKVERVRRDPLSGALSGMEVVAITFEDTPEVWNGTHMVKRPSKFELGMRLLLLESHYSAKEETP